MNLNRDQNYSIFIFFTISLFCLQGCNNSDYSEELSGNYFYIEESKDNKSIIDHLSLGKDIYPNVIDYAYNPNFIIAIQEPNYEEYRSLIAFYLRDDTSKYPKNSAEDLIKSEIVADSLLKYDLYYQKVFAHRINYWIISHIQKQVYGPYNKEQYFQKRKELNVPIALRLKE